MPLHFISPLPCMGRWQHNGREGGGGGVPPHLSSEGNADELSGRLEELYAELRARAERFTRGQPRDWSLQTTALVHETCLKLFGLERFHGADRGQILAVASAAMRSVLVDYARSRGRIKRLPPGERVPLDDISLSFEDRAVDLVALDEALQRLSSFDPLMARAVDLHFFAGLSLQETARILEVPLRTLERHWSSTRAWLRAEIAS